MRRTVLVVGLVILALIARVPAQSSTVTVHHNANLRAAPSTQSAILDHLEPGDELRLEEPTKQQGFWHVRTSTNVVGWVYQTLVHIDETDDLPTAPAVTAANAIDPTWAKPPIVGSSLSGPPGFPACPADGEAGGDIETNKRKNRKDIPSSYHQVTFDAVANLAYPTEAKVNRANWTAEQKDAIAPFEGIPISIVGFIVAVKKQSGGGGEGTNCHFNTTNFVDTHVALVKAPGQGEEKAIVVEPTPRFYAQHPSWVFSKLDALDDSPDPVRISGWLLLDPVHKGHLGTYRATLWEIHPITKIEVFKNGQWTTW